MPAYLRRCAPWLDPEQVRLLQRTDAYAWTTSDLPLPDAARQRLGDPAASRRRTRQRAVAAAEQERMAVVVDDLIRDDDSEMMVMSMLRGGDMRSALVDPDAGPAADPDRLAGPFAHVVVDEAQELTDAEWQMLLRRCPTRSLTVVGDRARARRGFTPSWQERLQRLGPGRARLRRGPRLGRRRLAGRARRRDRLRHRRSHLRAVPAGGVAQRRAGNGLEFDLVVLVDPDAFGSGVDVAVDRYVAMTRATQQLVVLTP